MSRKPVTLASRVAKVMRQVEKLQRKGRNQEADYPYPTASEVFEEVRGRLFDAGILLLPDENRPEYLDRETNGGSLMQECRLSVTYTFMDGETSLPPLKGNGNARDLKDKALYKAQTGAQKAFLKHFGLMAEEADDPEFDGDAEQPAESLEDVAPRRIPRKEKPLTEYQMDAIREGMQVTGKTEEQLSQSVASIGHGAELAQVKQKYFKDLLRWATDGRGTLTQFSGRNGKPSGISESRVKPSVGPKVGHASPPADLSQKDSRPDATPPTPLQMSLPKAPQAAELRIRNKTIEILPQKGVFSL